MDHAINKVTLNTENLTEVQLRILKQIHFLSIEAMKTDCEIEFFEKSSMLMQQMAKALMNSNFGSSDEFNFDAIPYAKQALEYSMENLEDLLEGKIAEDFDH